MCTEHAPHCATPQPYFVPVSPACSRSAQSSGVSASASTSRVLPLMLSFMSELLDLHLAPLDRAARQVFRRDVAELQRDRSLRILAVAERGGLHAVQDE